MKRKSRRFFLKRDLEQFEELRENVYYGQQLSHTGSWTYDFKRDKFFFTDQIYDILEIEPEEFNGTAQSFINYFNSIDQEEVKKALSSGEERDLDCRIVTPDGREKSVHITTKTIFDKNNNPIKTYGAIQDITDRKLIEANLKEMGEDLNLAQRVSGVGSWKYDVLNDKFYGTEEMFCIYGIEPSEFKNDFESTINLIHPEDQHKVINCLKEHLSGRPCRTEFRIPQKDGSIKYVKAKGRALFNDQGQVVSVLGVLRDVTQEKRLELELKKQHRIMEQGQTLAHMGSWEYELSKGVSSCSKETYRIFGIDPTNFDNKYESFLEYVHEEDREDVHKALSTPTKEPIEIEFRLVRKDGSVRNVHQISEYEYDEKGNPIFVYGVIKDITVKKKLREDIERKQKEIEKIQKRFQVLVHESSDVYEIVKPDGTIVYISDALEKVLGYKPKDRVGKNVYSFYKGEELEKVKRIFKTVLDNPELKPKEDIKLVLEDGGEKYLEVEMQNMLDNPIIEGLVINFRDVTDRIEMRNKLTYIYNHDEVTGLPNHVYFKERMYHICSKAKEERNSFGLLFISITGLSYVIYTLGYSIGQKLIVEIGNRIKVLFDNEEFIARYSEDCFAVVINKGEEVCRDFANKIIQEITKPYNIEQYELNVWANVGVHFFSDCNKSVDAFVQEALQTVLRAKREGKNKYKFYSSSFDIQNFKEFFFRNDLRKALKQIN